MQYLDEPATVDVPSFQLYSTVFLQQPFHLIVFFFDDQCKGGKGCDDDDDDDDDFVDYRSSRTTITCEIDGKNYLRCDPDTVVENDVNTCDEIEKEICGEGMDKDDKDLCECLFGPYEKGMPQLRGAVSVQVFFVQSAPRQCV